jgi:hypothetical protein
VIGKAVSVDLASTKAVKFGFVKEEIPGKTAAIGFPVSKSGESKQVLFF